MGNPIRYVDPSGNTSIDTVLHMADYGSIGDFGKVVGLPFIYYLFSKAKGDSGKSVEGGQTLPNQGTVKGDVEGAPPVDAGKQGKHVHEHNNNNPSKSQWPRGQDGVDLTQEAWQKGKTLPDGTKVWDTGKVIGSNGETGVRVHIDGKGNIHGYPVDPGQYFKKY